MINSTLPSTVAGSSLWKSSLGASVKGDASVALDRLRQSFLQFRSRAALLVAEIHRQLPDLTVHDITHLDGLWEMAGVIAGPNYRLTPVEAFVFGGAVLLHDAGMALVAYPNGLREICGGEVWDDLVTAEFERRFERAPKKTELAKPPEEIKNHVVACMLRNLHAQQSERLAALSWKTKGHTAPQFLIEDSEIRLALGRVIGLIAHSHWWPIQRLEAEFSRPIGAPSWCPKQWTVDPLKIACLLRLADASHIDARRAPSFLRALRQPNSSSDVHWSFQEKLQEPHVAEDTLVYTSGYAFPFSEAAAWWLCYDTLTMIDRELRQVDALLADKRQPRLLARRVAGVESPERIVSFVPTHGWLPIDAQVEVSDVPKLVKKMGGSELYGKNLSAALRELIQNSTDAIKARRIVESRNATWGEITVRLEKDKTGEWLEVADNGVGMSEQVLRRYLLDFGNSYWNSPLMLEEFPGLLANGMKPIGKYGIGFFSIFMLGSAVRVTSRRADAAQSSTLVMEFNTGLTVRPVIRRAEGFEQLRDGGTSIRVWLDTPSAKPGGLLTRGKEHSIKLGDLCRTIAPCLDVSLLVTEHGVSEQVCSAGDWVTCAPEELLRRMPTFGPKSTPSITKCRELAKCVRILKNQNGEIVGRGCISPERFSEDYPHGVVTVGGLKACALSGFTGVLTGLPRRASRDAATPIVEPSVLSTWATEQSTVTLAAHASNETRQSCASYIRRFGGDTVDLPIGRFRGVWWSFSKLSRERNLPDQIILISPYQIQDFESVSGFKITDQVFVVEYSSWHGILSDAQDHEWPGWPDVHFQKWKAKKGHSLRMMEGTLGGVVIEALALAWKIDLNALLSRSDFSERKNTQIGTLAGRSISAKGTIIRRKTRSR